ncbi:cobalt-precorrin-5B (C(1))-methyltransferase [Cucumibacter marinus]|uniref:cobalt-precorrin-5B (C(1))-methyltransferase n=1 Tax=Cucumibacter marinus TaxID=1121252 RepID=UPI0004228510|nr:cobalt-precorrin-5B (C(1))-methyltransferase [Cucumibacter marinus]
MSEIAPKTREDGTPLRRGWTTGACATAATKAALSALLGHGFPDPVEIALPGGQTPAFALAHEEVGEGFAEAGIIKDAGDDPDVTHGALIIARVARGKPGSGIRFHAGPGVGTVTKPGLPLAVGEPAINPVPREMISGVITTLCDAAGIPADIDVTISVPNGDKIAQKTWNPRLGILGGISILGTTGIVIPYSCAAWIHSIQRGVDVARALGLTHVVGATGDASEKAAMAALELQTEAYLDMGDFVGGLLKYLKAHPVPEVTICGGFAKMSKLAQGMLDLHSGRGTVDMAFLAGLARRAGGDADLSAAIEAANTGKEALDLALAAQIDLAGEVARDALQIATRALGNAKVTPHILVTDRNGKIIAQA